MTGAAGSAQQWQQATVAAVGVGRRAGTIVQLWLTGGATVCEPGPQLPPRVDAI